MKKNLILLMCIIILAGSVFNGCVNGNENFQKDNSTVSNIIYHTVSFETNGGTAVSSKSIKTLEKAPSTQREGYVFDGWFRDKNLTVAVVYPLDIDADLTLYASWVKTNDEKLLSDCRVKFMDDDFSSALSCNITPSGFDYDRLEAHGANGLVITVTYSVYYRKDYDVWLDIGYAGSPKYEVAISNSDGQGKLKSDLSTSKSSETRTISISTTFDYFENDMEQIHSVVNEYIDMYSQVYLSSLFLDILFFPLITYKILYILRIYQLHMSGQI